MKDDPLQRYPSRILYEWRNERNEIGSSMHECDTELIIPRGERSDLWQLGDTLSRSKRAVESSRTRPNLNWWFDSADVRVESRNNSRGSAIIWMQSVSRWQTLSPWIMLTVHNCSIKFGGSARLIIMRATHIRPICETMLGAFKVVTKSDGHFYHQPCYFR